MARSDHTKETIHAPPHDNARSLRIEVDYERYEHLLDDPNLTEDQKRELLQTLWSVVVEFVSLGFGVHPLQQAQKPCGEPQENVPNPALEAPNALYLKHSFLTQHFKELTDLETEAAKEGTKT